MPVGDGWDTHIGVGHETAWGTPVAPTAFLEHAGISGGQVQPQLQGDTFRGRSNRVLFRGAKSDALQVISELQYEGWEDIFYHLFGNVATSNPNMVFQHDFTFNDANPLPAGSEVSLTVEEKLSAAATLRHAGMKVNQVTLDAAIDKVLKATIDLVGKQEASASPASASYNSSPLIIWDEITIEQNAAAKECESAQIVISNNYITDRRVLGDVAVKEHRPGRRGITGTITAFFEDLATWHALFDGNTSFALKLTATSTLAIPSSSPTDFYDFILTLPNVKLETHEKPVPDAGPLRQTMAFVAFATAAAELATLTITNERTTVP